MSTEAILKAWAEANKFNGLLSMLRHELTLPQYIEGIIKAEEDIIKNRIESIKEMKERVRTDPFYTTGPFAAPNTQSMLRSIKTQEELVEDRKLELKRLKEIRERVSTL